MERMAKKAVGMFLAFMIYFAPLASAGDPVTKLVRGLANVAESPVELIASYQRLAVTNNPLLAVVGGSVWGAGAVVTRAVVGVYEIATFPFPIPPHYDPILRPETPFEGLSELKE